MTKQIRKSMLFVLLGLSFLPSCSKTSNKRTEYKGTYHVGVVDELDRGADIVALLNSDNTIYTITEDTSSTYSICSKSGTILWGIKSNQIFSNIASCSVAEIKSWKVKLDDKGLPNAIEGMNQDWIQAPIVDGIGLSVLALQDAFKAL